jgi:hypothetical protein
MASRTTSSVRRLAAAAAAMLAVATAVLLAALPAQASEASSVKSRGVVFGRRSGDLL